MAIITVEPQLSRAREVALKLREVYRTDGLKAELHECLDKFSRVMQDVAINATDLKDAELALKTEDQQLLLTVTGKNETERKAAHADARFSSDNYKVLYQQVQTMTRKEAELNAELEIVKFHMRCLEAEARLTCTEMSILGVDA